MRSALRILFLIPFFFVFKFGLTQESAKIYGIKGTRIIFNFESIKDIQNGKTLGTGPSGFTEFDIYFLHPTIGTWELYVKALTSTLDPDYGAATVSLSAIKLYTYLDGVYYNTITLSDAEQLIATATNDYTAGGSHTITIVYECATGGELFGLNTDIFRTDLNFDLRSQ
jgi:hypothetical protein